MRYDFTGWFKRMMKTWLSSMKTSQRAANYKRPTTEAVRVRVPSTVESSWPSRWTASVNVISAVSNWKQTMTAAAFSIFLSVLVGQHFEPTTPQKKEWRRGRATKLIMRTELSETGPESIKITNRQGWGTTHVSPLHKPPLDQERSHSPFKGLSAFNKQVKLSRTRLASEDQ